MSPPLAPDPVLRPEERARTAFNQVATAAWLAYRRGQLTRTEYERGILAARTTYQLVLDHPELAPTPPRQPHGEALRQELVQQAVRMLRQPGDPRRPGSHAQAGEGTSASRQYTA